MNPHRFGALIVCCTTLVGCATNSSVSTAPSSVLPRQLDESPRAVRTGGQKQDPPKQSDRRTMPWELSVGGAGSSSDNFDAGGAQATGSVGYFLNDIVEVSARQNGSYGDPGPGVPGVWNFVSRAAIDFHLPLGRVAPYVGANFGYVYGDSVKDSLVAGPEAGVKFFLKDDVFLQLGAEYEYFFDKGDSLQTAFDDGQLLYALSMGMRF